MANCRTVDDILPDINDHAAPTSPSATIAYRLGDEELTLNWKGERGETPFTRMAVFDTAAVQFHVDEDLSYVYTPASLALFNQVSQGVQAIKQRIDDAVKELRPLGSQLVGRFDRGSSVYPIIETLGAATDLVALKQQANVSAKAEEELSSLQLTVASLKANTIAEQISSRQRTVKALTQAATTAAALMALPVASYNRALAKLSELKKDYEAFRTSLFAAADLPAEPDDTWDAFVRAAEAYKAHLQDLHVHDGDRCLYCRQAVEESASALLSKYGEYLADRIALDIRAQETLVASVPSPASAATVADLRGFLADHPDGPEAQAVRVVLEVAEAVNVALSGRETLDEQLVNSVRDVEVGVTGTKERLEGEVVELRTQSANRDQALAEKEGELRELQARLEIKRSWDQIEQRVRDAQESDKLSTLGKKFQGVLRQLTDLSKQASNQLINRNFGERFDEECKALRTPPLRLEFVGREGKAQRRKTLAGNYKPSKILSEGEQKVLAIADFLAEARLVGITAPIIFDDPVCSLDYRRINEVAKRVALLAQEHQVVVFTHDIFFATTLLSLFEKSPGRCSYFQVSDDGGKGHVARATGPRWDTLNNLKKNINATIDAARKVEGEARASLVRTGYDWLRSWCEVFVERELLAEVTLRYQPNVKMTALSKLKPDRMQDVIDTIVSIFEEACRYIDGHSQPLPTLGVAPTLQGLESDWKTAEECRAKYLAA